METLRRERRNQEWRASKRERRDGGRRRWGCVRHVGGDIEQEIEHTHLPRTKPSTPYASRVDLSHTSALGMK